MTIPDGMTEIVCGAFYCCNSLTNITIPDSVTSIGSTAFSGCTSLSDVYYSGTKAQWDTIAINVSNDCLKNATLHCYVAGGKCGDNLTWTLDENDTLTISGTGGMYNYSYDNTPWNNKNSSIKTVVIEAGMTSIGSYAFYGCTSLASIEIPNSVTSIGEDAFCCCSSLTSVVIPNSVTSIGDTAFGGCYSLRSIEIPNSVTYIDGQAFSRCTNLSDVYYSGTRAQWEAILIDSGNEPLLEATIHCSDDGTFYTVTLPGGFNGEPSAAEGSNYIFTAADASKKYLLSATMGSQPVNITDAGDGNYLIYNVTGDIIITALEQAKYAVSILDDDMSESETFTGAAEVYAGDTYTFTFRDMPADYHCYDYHFTVTMDDDADSQPQPMFSLLRSALSSLISTAEGDESDVQTPPEGEIPSDDIPTHTEEPEIPAEPTTSPYIDEPTPTSVPFIPGETLLVRDNGDGTFTVVDQYYEPVPITGNLTIIYTGRTLKTTGIYSVTKQGSGKGEEVLIELPQDYAPINQDYVFNVKHHEMNIKTQFPITVTINGIDYIVLGGDNDITLTVDGDYWNITIPASMVTGDILISASCTQEVKCAVIFEDNYYAAEKYLNYRFTAFKIVLVTTDQNGVTTRTLLDNYINRYTRKIKIELEPYTNLRFEVVTPNTNSSGKYYTEPNINCYKYNFSGSKMGLKSLGNEYYFQDNLLYLLDYSESQESDGTYHMDYIVGELTGDTVIKLKPYMFKFGVSVTGDGADAIDLPKTYASYRSNFKFTNEKPDEVKVDKITVGGKTISEGSGYTVDGDTCTIRGGYIKGDIVIDTSCYKQLYIVTYDMNGGYEDYSLFNSQIKIAGETLTLHTAVPVHPDKLEFLGWALSDTAKEAEYEAGGSFDIDAYTTLYAVWGEASEVNVPKFIVSESRGVPGKTAVVSVKIADNPGIIGMTLGFEYNTQIFTLSKITGEGLGGDWHSAKKLTWANSSDVFFNGKILTLEFTISENAPLGTYPVSISYSPGDICNENREPVDFDIISGSINVNNHIPGDVNGDGVVNTKDFVTLMRYCAEDETVTYDPNALDINNDCNVNTIDFITLMQYIAGKDVEIF